MYDIEELEKKLHALNPITPSPQLRNKCLSRPMQDSGLRKWWGLAAAIMLSVVCWNYYENGRLEEIIAQNVDQQQPSIASYRQIEAFVDISLPLLQVNSSYVPYVKGNGYVPYGKWTKKLVVSLN